MNHLWEAYWGVGIVETVEDFGAQGEPPSHPELLDWQATEFMARGWDLKAMHTFCRRTSLYPSMVSFDASSRAYCVLRRNRSNTPLQTLPLLNEPVCVEPGCPPPGRATVSVSAFRLSRRRQKCDGSSRCSTGNWPGSSSNAKAAGKMAASEPRAFCRGVDLAQLAAWTVVANVLLNLDELISKR